MRLPTLSLAALALGAAASAGADDLTIVSKVTSNAGPPATATSYLATDHARIAQGDGRELIADAKAGVITVIDGRKKQYFLVTKQDLEQLKARIQQQMSSPDMQKAQSQMKNLPPEVQKRMEAAMGGLAGSVTVQKTGGTKKIAGYNCEEWTVAFGQMSKTEECLSTELPLPTQTWAMYKEFAESMTAAMGAMGPMAKGMSDLQAKMKEMKGYPLSRTTSASMMGRSTTSTSEVVEVKRGAIPASAWEVPAGYTKVDNPMLKGMPATN
jgi:Domain of unknown function (DUF4412)